MINLKVFTLFFATLIAVSSAHAEFDHSHKKWGEVLTKYLKDIPGSSQFDYKGVKADSATLDAYLKDVSAVTKDQYNKWSDNQKMAFLINAYNAYTIKFIIKDDIPKSIKDKGSLFSSPWKKKFFKIFGKDTHLDHLEHGMARKEFNNCRVHFAFNCASIGCPALLGEPFVADKLDEQYEISTKKFLTDKTRNRYNAEKNELELSKIFDWYEDDFSKDKTCGSVAKFVSKYITDDPALQKKIAESNPDIDHLKYDWNLNIKK